jgi:hypothetical protein
VREGCCGQVSKKRRGNNCKIMTKNERSVKNGLSLDPKSNEMTKNGSKPYLWHRFLVLMGYLSSGSKVYGLCLRGFLEDLILKKQKRLIKGDFQGFLRPDGISHRLSVF